MSVPVCARVHEGKPPSGQAAAKRARVRVTSTRSEQFRMQFDWMNFQQRLQTLQFNRYGRVVRRSVGGIACNIRG